MEDDDITVKVMKKKLSYEFVVPNYRLCRDGCAVGHVIKSPAFTVGGCPFRILFYPQGKNEAVHSDGWMSMFIINEGPKPVECVYGLCILKQIGRRSFSGFSYEDRIGFREVLTLKPHCLEGKFRFQKRDFIEYPSRFYVVGDCIRIRATIGVFIDLPLPLPHLPLPRGNKLSQPFHPYIFFRLDSGIRYAVEESVLRTRCPQLLHQYRHNCDILIPDIKRDMFEAVLWYVYNKKLHKYDREAISKSEPYDLNSFASMLLAAADRLNLKRLRRQCESFLSSNIEEHGLYYRIKSNFEKLWSGARGLLNSSTKDKKKWIGEKRAVAQHSKGVML